MDDVRVKKNTFLASGKKIPPEHIVKKSAECRVEGW